MNQRDLNRQVARATGESVTTISRLGFGRLLPQFASDPLVIDWDQLDAARNVSFARPRPPHSPIH